LSVADQDTEALDILRRLEPVLHTTQRDVDAARADLRTLRESVVDARERLIRIEASLPHLATAASAARLPGRAELWGAIGALGVIFTIVLGALPYVWKHLPP
jgi:hypothetical protein